MNDLDDELAAAFERLAERAPHQSDLAGRVRRQARRRQTIVGAGFAAGSVAVVMTALLVRPTDRVAPARPPAKVTVVGPASCAVSVPRTVIPEWARTGFSDPEPVAPVVRSAGGDVVAIYFGDGLASPPRPNISNKVLWVWRQLPAEVSQIHASARLNGTGPVVTTGLPTPVGPSSVDLPSPGCWRLTLTWPGGSDTIDLRAMSPADLPDSTDK